MSEKIVTFTKFHVQLQFFSIEIKTLNSPPESDSLGDTSKFVTVYFGIPSISPFGRNWSSIHTAHYAYFKNIKSSAISVLRPIFYFDAFCSSTFSQQILLGQ